MLTTADCTTAPPQSEASEPNSLPPTLKNTGRQGVFVNAFKLYLLGCNHMGFWWNAGPWGSVVVYEGPEEIGTVRSPKEAEALIVERVKAILANMEGWR